MAEFVCPKCGRGDMNELALCVVLRPVTKWTTHGKPADYAYPEVDWESDMPYVALGGPKTPLRTTLECSHCGEHFEKPRRIDRPRQSEGTC